MIDKRIFTFWLSEDGTVPPFISRFIDTQKLAGYEHRLITLDNCYRGSVYVQQAIAAKKWVKAVDYLRMHYLYEEGGITLDADVEILDGRNFDSLLHNNMFAAREENGFIGAAVIGAVKNYQFVKCWMDDVVVNFRGDDDKNFESSMDILVRGYFEKGWPKDGFSLVPTKTFYPYNHQTGVTDVTEDTVCMHHFIKTWV